MQLKTARATIILAISFTLAVWSSPVRPVFDSRYGTLQPAWTIPHVAYLPVAYHGFPIYPVFRQPINPVQQGFYGPSIFSPERLLHPFNNVFPVTNYVRQDLGDFNAMYRELYNTPTDVKDQVIVSSLEQIPRDPNFTDKSLLFSVLNIFGRPNIFVQRMTSFPNIKLTYKNITLNGIEFG